MVVWLSEGVRCESDGYMRREALVDGGVHERGEEDLVA